MTAYVLTGLGSGDEGKGTSAQWLCQEKDVHTVIRTGGPQAMHNVVTAEGVHFTFSRFGSGTLNGAKTHLSQHMVIDAYSLIEEGNDLVTMGFTDVFDRLTVDQNALAITPPQAIANRLQELARGPNRHGSVGIGVGETILDNEILGDMAVRVKDFGTPGLREKLEAIRIYKLTQLAPILERIGELTGRAQQEAARLSNPGIVDWSVKQFGSFASAIDIVDSTYLDEILRQPGDVVFEPSQGVLLDRWYGFHPHTTKVETTSEDALSLLRSHGYMGEVVRLGIIRAYQTRHGAGPFVTEDATLTQQLNEPHNGDHEWQGPFRVGPFDTFATSYAIEAAGGTAAFDGLVITCLDRLYDLPVWHICDWYVPPDGSDDLTDYFAFEDGAIVDIVVRPNTRDEAHLSHQERLGQLLRSCQSKCSLFNPGYFSTSQEAAEEFSVWIGSSLTLPVAVMSVGPTEQDKIQRFPL